MSNERIDLTQFERLPKKMEIKWHEHPLYGARYLVQISEPKTPWAVGSIAPDYEPHGVYAKDKIEQEKMAKMFAATPDLIAELKRCYEEIDALRSITQDWVKIETFTDDGKDLSVDMEDSDGNCFSGYINRASE
jgi:hypothetical protein